MPHTVLKNLQENEEAACSFIADPNTDIKREGSDIKRWISRSQNHLKLEAERPSKSLTDLASGHHAIVFKKSRCINEDILLLANQSGSHGFICVTFYTSGGHEEEQTILSNFQQSSDNWYEISATNTEINIWGKENGKTKRVTIHHAVHSWTTLFIEYLGAYPQIHGSYIINNDLKLTGTFTFDSSDEKSSGFSVGNRYDNTRFLQGEIAIYHGKGKKQIPQDLVIKNQLIESTDIGDEEPLPVKKKKI